MHCFQPPSCSVGQLRFSDDGAQVFPSTTAQSLLLLLLLQHRIRKAQENPPRRSGGKVNNPLTLFAVFRPIATINRPERFSGQEKHPHGMVRILHR
jgi:hypothetical protein